MGFGNSIASCLNRLHRGLAAGVVAVGLLGIGAGSAAADTVFSHDFECPVFNTGALPGQNGWAFGGTVQSSVVSTLGGGARSVQLVATGLSGTVAAGRFVSVPTAGQTYTYSCDFRRTGNLSPAAGIAIAGDTGFIAQLVGGGGGYLLGNTNSNTPLQPFADATWHRLVITMNFSTLTMSATINGTSLGSLPINNATAPSRITQIQVSTGGSVSAHEIFFDNISLVGSLPVGNLCADATPIFVGSTPFSTIGATTNGPGHALCDFFGSLDITNDIWYQYTPSASGVVTVSTCGANYDSKIAAYSGTCATLATTILACNDDSVICAGNSLQSLVTFTAIAGQPHLIRIGGFDGATGAGSITLSLVSTGGCCNTRTGSCLAMDGGQCATLGLDFLGYGAACSPTNCKSCPADFNRSGGGPTVQDIFDFLSSWFAGCP